MKSVTFLCPNKKVTKEVVRGEALRAKSTLAPDPTPAATTTARRKCPDFQRALRYKLADLQNVSVQKSEHF